MNSLEVNGHDYQFAKLSALAQFHIVRRLAPIIGELLNGIDPKSFKDGKPNISQADMLKALGPISTALAKLSDEEANYVLFGLLKVVQRKQVGGGWANIATGESLMFEDIDMKIMIQLSVKSFMVNLGGFISALPSVSKEQAASVI